MIRRIITIDEEKCNGCGLCADACHEGAIGIVDGKAKLLREDYCDGLGDCLPACPMAEVTVEARGKDGVSIFTQRLFLHSRCEGILTSFFTCIGLRKKGDDLNMDWGKVEGCTGWAKLTVREFTTRNGNDMTVNDVGRWLAPDDNRIPKDDGGDDW